MAEDDDLDALFAQARRQDAPSADLLARVEVDARLLQPKGRIASAAPAEPPRAATGFWREMAAAIGGWRATGGLSAAVLLGFWLGVSDPSGLLVPAGGLDSVDLMPGADDLTATQGDEGQNG